MFGTVTLNWHIPEETRPANFLSAALDRESAYEFLTRLQLVHPQILLTDASSARMAEKFAMPCECYFLSICLPGGIAG